MVVITGKYSFLSSENLMEYMTAIGVGLSTRKIAELQKPTIIITTSGDEYTIKNMNYFNFEIKFKLGESFEEITPDGRKYMTVITMETDTKMKQVQKVQGTDIEYVTYREFTPEGMIVLLEAPNVICKRVYKKDFDL